MVPRVSSIAFAFGCLAILSGSATAENPYQWRPPVALMPEAGTSGGRPSLLSPGPDVAYAVFVGGDLPAGITSDVYFSRTVDAGRTWSDPVLLESDPDQQFMSSLSTIGGDRAGHVYVVWSRHGDNLTIPVFNRSADGGATWLPSEVGVGGSIGGLDNPVLASDEAGNVLVAANTADIWVNVSHDFGLSWHAEPYLLETIPGWSRAMTLASGGNGIFYAIFMATKLERRLPPEGEGQYFTMSWDAGETWTPARRIDGETFVPAKPLVVADPVGHVYLAWQGRVADFGYRDLYLARSEDYGQNFEPPVRVNRDPPGLAGVGTVDVVADCHGTVYAVYDSNRDRTVGHSFLNRSDDFGRTWLASDIRVTQDTSPDGGVCCQRIACLDDGQLVVAWSDNRRAGFALSDIFANVSFDGGNTWLAEDVRLDVGLDTWQSAMSQTVLNSSGQAFVGWFDETADEAAMSPHIASGFPLLEISVGDGPALVPRNGGVATAHVRLRNNGTETLANLSLWVDGTRPSGRTTPPLFGPITIGPLAPGDIRKTTRLFRVPARLRSGGFLVNLHVGAPIGDHGSFCIVKLP